MQKRRLPYPSEKYDGDVKDVFSVQDAISLAIADKLKIKVQEKRERKIDDRFLTYHIEAYNLYFFKGRYFWNKRKEEDLKKAIQCYSAAIQIDLNYALAYAGLADCCINLHYYHTLPAKEAFSKGKGSGHQTSRG